jgi:predicted acetyltransferase
LTEIRRGRAEDRPAIDALLRDAFLDTAGEDVPMLHPAVFEPGRSLLVDAADGLAAHFGGYGRDLVVPGGTVAAAHLAAGATRPVDRGRGLFAALARRQVLELRAAGQEPVSVLCASEAGIYGRFGYGLAATRLQISADLRELGDVPPADERITLTEMSQTRALPLMRAVYERVRPERVGWSGRNAAWWAVLTDDPPSRRYGASAWRVVLASDSSQVAGYAIWRSDGRWDDLGPAGAVEVREFVSADATATRALWRYLLTMRLCRGLTYPYAAIDDPLLHLVGEPRRLGATVADALWVRLLDVAAALSARRYAAPVDAVLDVADAMLPDNARRWRLCGDRSGATCEPTNAPAVVSLDVRELGAAYLGGTSLNALAGAGRLHVARPAAFDALSVGFGWCRQPSVTEVF